MNQETPEDFPELLKSNVQKRLMAAMIDMVIVSVACYAVLQADGALLPGGIRSLFFPGLLLLGAILLLEMMTGQTLGKFSQGLSVQTSAGGRPQIWQTIVRALARWIPPLLAIASLLTHSLIGKSLLIGLGMTVVICELPCCYITFFRLGGSLFDLAGGTRIRMTGTDSDQNNADASGGVGKQ
jgi:uncharacterized RDD family membrane protein YckC